jgi:hypothetical protein
MQAQVLEVIYLCNRLKNKQQSNYMMKKRA